MVSTEHLILDLSADLAPVRRRSLRRETGVLLAVVAAELLLVVVGGEVRPDMGRVILSPAMAWKIGSLALLAATSCRFAMRSFVPPAPSRAGLALTLGLAALVMAAGMFVTPAADWSRTPLERLAPMHGLRCLAAIVGLAVPMMALLGLLMRRAAPVRPARSALATGLASSTCGALVFTACCPMSDPLYIVVWYAAAIALVTGAARWLLPWRLRL